MPTANIVRRGKRALSIRVTLVSRKRKILTYYGRRSSRHNLIARTSNNEKSARKKTFTVGSALSGSFRMKKKYPRTGETHQMPPPRLIVEFHNEEIETISDIVQSLSGEVTTSHLLDTLTARGFERNFAVDKVQQLVDARKVLIDNDGYICWTYNPVLAAHYRDHSELRIR
jgi:hypothetical protein